MAYRALSTLCCCVLLMIFGATPLCSTCSVATKAPTRAFRASRSFTFRFFFSSRRRHTRLVSDWSSDVCSSDLSASGIEPPPATISPASYRKALVPSTVQRRVVGRRSLDAIPFLPPVLDPADHFLDLKSERTERSEERRVGKECRSRWSPDHEKK